MLTRMLEKSYPMDGAPRSALLNAGSSLSSGFSPSALMGDSISGAVVSSSISIRFESGWSAMCVSVEPAACEREGGGVGCWSTSGVVTIAS
jgi:hypothetical protein